MFGKAFGLVQQVIGGLALLIAAVEESGTTDGAAKKAQVVSQVESLIAPALPSWAKPILMAIAPFLIDQLVAFANSSGLFSKATPATV